MITKKTTVIFILILLISSLAIPIVMGTSNTMSSDQDLHFYKSIFTKFISKIKIKGIGGPLSVFQLVKGYVEYSDGSNIPNGVVVTITDENNGNSMTVKTQQANEGPGCYLVQVEDLDAENGDTILVNVSYGGCQGNNSVIVNTSQGPSLWCNVTIYGNLPPAIPSQPSGPTSGYINTSYNYSTSTWDPDDDDIYYWFDWDDDSNSGWLGPYSSNETCTASHSWNETGIYQVKTKAKDEHGAELGTLWSDPLNVTIIISQPPNEPSDPDPEDEATDVDVDADLSWNCSDPDGDELTYDVYFEAGDPTPDELVSNNQTNKTYDPGTMEYETTYYWQIVAWDPYGFSTEGAVWDFTTMSEPNEPPYTPSDPSPENGSIDIDINTDLSWTGGDPDEGDTVVYDVYLEANDSTPDIKVANDISETTFDPGKLEYEVTYYWQILAKDNHEASTWGPIWHFTTVEAPEPDLDCDGSLGWSDVEPGSTVTGSFTVKNIGESNSELDWEVVEWPSWGTWTFDPEDGEDLAPEDGSITVNVSVTAPNQQNEEFTGEVKVVNKENSSDYEIIPASLVTPVNQQSFMMVLSKNFKTFNLLSRLISIKILSLQRFSKLILSNSDAPSSNLITEDIEDSASVSTSSVSVTQQSSNQNNQSDGSISSSSSSSSISSGASSDSGSSSDEENSASGDFSDSSNNENEGSSESPSDTSAGSDDFPGVPQ